MLTRTRRRARLAVKAFLFDSVNLQELVSERRNNELEDNMGFRGQWEEHRRFQFAFLKAQGVTPASRFLEIGCGPLTAGIPLIGYLNAGNYIGVDIRPSVLNLGWGEIGAAGLSAKNPRLICSESFGCDELGGERFDFVLSFSVLYHLNDAILMEYFEQIARRLRPHGRCFAQINTHLDDSRWLQFPFLKRTPAQYEQVALAAGLKTQSLGTIDKLGFKLPGEERLNEMLVFLAPS